MGTYELFFFLEKVRKSVKGLLEIDCTVTHAMVKKEMVRSAQRMRKKFG